jgi:DNA polymerase-3 subunit delta'
MSWLAVRISKKVEPQTVLEVAAGAPLAALALADEGCWNRRSQLLVSYERLLMGKTDPIQLVEFWLQGYLLENLRWLIGWHSDLIRLKMSPEPPWLANPDLGLMLRRCGHLLSAQFLFERLDAAMRLYALCSTTQANPQLLLEIFFSDSAGSSELDVSACHHKG